MDLLIDMIYCILNILDDLHKIVVELSKSVDIIKTNFIMAEEARSMANRKLHSNMTKLARDMSDLKDTLLVVPDSFYHWPMESLKDMDDLLQKTSSDAKFRTQLVRHH